MRKLLCSAVRTVAAYNNNAVYAVLAADIRALLNTLISLEFKAARSSQNGAAQTDYLGYRVSVHIYYLFIQKALKAFLYTFYLKSVGYGFADNGSDSRVHSRRIAAAGEYAYGLYFLICHLFCLLTDKVSPNILFYHAVFFNTS